MWRFPALILLLLLLKLLVCIQVIVPQKEISTAPFTSVILSCNYYTSAYYEDVLVTWRYKSFCKEHENNSTSYQSALQFRKDPLTDCPDRQRTVLTVIQRVGTKRTTLGLHYRGRNITLQNKADLVIHEVMWSDSGVYYCSVDAAGDSFGDSDKKVKLFISLSSKSQKDAVNLPTVL